MDKLLSIAVPTKDRYEFLKCFIELINSFKCDEIEMIIQDNSSNNTEFIDYLKKHKFPFLKYYHISEPISMSQNCDEAISHCTGKYVCLMGDDDFVTRELIQYVHYMDDKGIDAASFAEKPHYSWPGVKYVKHAIPNLYIPVFSRNEYRINCRKALHKLISHGAAELKGIPKLYHAVVLKDRLDIIRSKIGTCFPGESPDIAIGIALSTVVKNAVICDVPYIVSGTVPKSAGGMGAAHTHNSKIEDVPWLSKNAKAAWEKRIPAIWTGTTVYADTAIKTLRALKCRKELRKFNYLYSYAFSLVFENDCFAYVKKLISDKKFDWLKIALYVFEITCYRAYHYFNNIRIFKLNLTKAYKNNNVKDSYMASKIVSSLINSPK